MEGLTQSPAAHLPTPPTYFLISAIFCAIAVAVKKIVKNSTVLASYIAEIVTEH